MDLQEKLDMALYESDLSTSIDQSMVNPLAHDMETNQDMILEEQVESSLASWESPLIFGSAATDQALGLDLLPNQHMVIAGRTEGSLMENFTGTFADGFVALITSSGEIDWLRQLGGTAVDQFLDVIYHPQGVIIAGGFSTGDLPEQVNTLFVDGLLVALDTDGNILWQKLINLGTINRLAVAEDGFIIVGSYEQADGDYAAFIAKYRLSGEQEWLQAVNSPSYDSATSVTIHQNRIFVSGFTSGSILNSVARENMDMFVAAYSLEGEQLWLKEYGSNGDDSPVRISHDQESLIVAGYTSGLLGSQHYGGNDVAVLKLNLEGDLLWQKQFGTFGSEAAYGLSITPEHDIFISGRIDEASWTEQPNRGGDAFILKMNQFGELVKLIQFPQEGRDEVVDLTYGQGTIHLTGYVSSSAQPETEQNDIFVHRISDLDSLE